jgi:hypothetical protein
LTEKLKFTSDRDLSRNKKKCLGAVGEKNVDRSCLKRGKVMNSIGLRKRSRMELHRVRDMVGHRFR